MTTIWLPTAQGATKRPIESWHGRFKKPPGRNLLRQTVRYIVCFPRFRSLFALWSKTPLGGDMASQFTKKTRADSGVTTTDGQPTVSREQLVDLLNEDLAREYQAVIAYVVYSQVIKGAAYMSI